jgi:hypothetical protein
VGVALSTQQVSRPCSRTGAFVWALAFMAVLALLGALSYIFILGDARRVELPTLALET